MIKLNSKRMAKNIFLNIDDDVAKAVNRIQKEKSADLTLVLPKGSWLLANPANLKLLKKQAELLGKQIAIMTRDEKGRQYAAQHGFEIKEPDYINRGRTNFDVGAKSKPQAPNENQAAEPPVIETPQTTPAMPAAEPVAASFMPAAEELQKIFEDSPDQSQQQKQLLLDPDLKTVNRPRRGLRAAVFAAVILFILILVFVLPSAEITVFARTQPISRDFQISADRNLAAPNLDQLAVPGKLLGDDQDYAVKLNATGQLNVGTQARGTVQIYNFTGRVLKLGAATTTLTIGTKTFHFGADVLSIKPTRYFAGTKDPDPASLGPEVQIIADQPGEDSDFPAGDRAEIHNQILGTIPQQLYAKVVTPVDNGTTRLRTVVSQQDLDNARKNYLQAFTDMERKKYAAQDLTILDSGTNVQLVSLNFDQKAGDETQSFNASGHAIFSALGFSADQVRNLIEQRINLTLGASQYLVTGGSENITETFRNLDLNSGTGSLDVHFESTVAAKIDTAGIASKINGKTAPQLKELLLSDPNIDAVNIKFQPFWVRSVPSFSGRVKVDARLSQPAQQ